MMRVWKLALPSILVLVACDSKPRHEPVVVYAAADHEIALSVWFDLFTDETGIPVTLRYGDSGSNTASVIRNQGSPPADLLFTNNVADIWLAADQGALRPIVSTSLQARPPYLRDPDAMWIALDYRLAVIARHAAASDLEPLHYADLAAPEYQGQLCLASSALALNRSLIAMMINDRGARPAEITVRGWMRNLAVPPFESEAKLQNAIDAGTCDFGILSKKFAIGSNNTVPDGAYFDIDGIGIVRHARYPDSAQRLLDWLLVHTVLKLPPGSSQSNIGLAGWRDEDATLLAERAGYR